jgi:hypothetical protein
VSTDVDAAIEKAWADESDARFCEYKEGKVTVVSYAVVVERLKAKK